MDNDQTVEFFLQGIHELPDRWEMVGAKDGQYFEFRIFFSFSYNQKWNLGKKRTNLPLLLISKQQIVNDVASKPHELTERNRRSVQVH